MHFLFVQQQNLRCSMIASQILMYTWLSTQQDFDPLFTIGTGLSSLISDSVVARRKWLTLQGFVIAEVDCRNPAVAASLEVIVPIVHICTGGDCTYCPYPCRIWLYLLSISRQELIVLVVHICAGVDWTCCPYPCRSWLYLLFISVLELIVPVVHICTGVDCTCYPYLSKTSGLQHHRVRVLHRQG